MKKLLAILMIIATILSFAACGSKEKPETTTQGNETTTEAPVIEGKELTVENGKGGKVTVTYPADFTFNKDNTEGNFLAQTEITKCGTLERKDVNIGFAFAISSAAYDSVHEYLRKCFSKNTIFEEGKAGEFKTYIRQNITSAMQIIVCLNDFEFCMIEFKLPDGATKDNYAELYAGDMFKNILNSIKVEVGTGEDEGIAGDPITSEKGYVTVTPCGGFVYDEAESTGNITLKNSSLGATAAIYVYDKQDMELEPQKKYFSYAYPNKEFTQLTVGENTFESIVSNTGITNLVAVTSSGYAMYIQLWNCSVEDAMSVLETVEIN